MSSSTVPAIWALTGLGITTIVSIVYIGVIFVFLAIVLWGILTLASAIARAIFGHL